MNWLRMGRGRWGVRLGRLEDSKGGYGFNFCCIALRY